MSKEDVVKEIKKRETFLITTHINPEGDAIGSSLALALALISAGKKVSVYTRDPVPGNLKFLPYSDTVHQIKGVEDLDERFDAVITVDCGDLERVGYLTPDNIPGDILINVDHHVTNIGFGDVNFVEDSVASAELVLEIMDMLHIPVTQDIAICIYAALITETGSFRYANTDSNTFRIAEEMVKAGANPWEIAEYIYNRNNMGRLRLMGSVLATLAVHDNGKISWINVREKMYEETGTTKDDVEDFINYPRSVIGVEVAVLFRETNSDWKISMRSNGKVDVSSLAMTFGGGGHKMAAGFVMKGTLEEVQKKVIGRIEEAVRVLCPT